MKRLLIVMIFCLSGCVGYAQYNLVPNYSFEDSVLCPSTANRDVLPRPWYSPGSYGSNYYRYLHSCAITYNWGMPYNIYYDQTGNPDTSFQYAKTGQGYAIIEHSYDVSFPPNSRYYLQVKLKDSLRPGKCYYSAFWASLINPVNYATNNIAMWLNRTAVYSDTIANPFGLGLIAANPQVFNYGNPVIKDTMNWVKISSVITAAGGERYLTIGNFKNDANTIVQVVNTGGANRATYYIDDVFVIPLDSMQLKADAGPDRTIVSGDSTFIGSLTNGLTSIMWRNSNGSVINTTAPGLYVKPTANTFYTLEQTVCGQYSKDTVQITVTPPLPLKLLNFTATVIGGKVLLQWQTANEMNVSHFNVQRSVDGQSFINMAKATASNQSFNQYYFTDTVSATGTRYYRIESIDRDGKKQYSIIRSVIFGSEKPVLIIYPNPAQNFITIESSNLRKVEILNTYGIVVISKKIVANHATVSLEEIGRGIYIVKITDANNNLIVQKIVKN